MAVLEIKKFNEPVLRKKCRKIKKINRAVRNLIIDMAQTMVKNQGIGLAAPQVGVSKRIIVAAANLPGQRIFEIINPQITKKSAETEFEEEGCLSFPNIFLKIKRAKNIEVKGLDIKGRQIKLKAKGILARVLQHEIDHLDGILFFHRLNFLEKVKFKIKYPRIKF
jgi:peptide deformylase